jgi:hypothetical protein
MIDWLRQNASWVGPLLSGVSLFLAAVIAWVVYNFAEKKNVEAAWINSCSGLYSEFWKDDRIAEVRYWIASDAGYAEIQPILAARMRDKRNTLGAAESKVLEKIDVFCAVISRIQFFLEFSYRVRLTPRQRALWEIAYGDFWISKISSRPELADYVREYWTGIALTRE